MMGPSQRRLTSWEKKCHGYDFGRLLGDGMVGEDSDGGLLFVNERDVVVARFSETGVF